MNNLNELTPASVWSYFENICQIPRPSKHEEKIIGFLMDFARQNNLPAKKDAAGNVLISKPASQGRIDCFSLFGCDETAKLKKKINKSK